MGERPVRQNGPVAAANHFAAPTGSIKFIPSGCKLLDLVLGGGWALGRVSNVVGDKAVGKTLLAIEACTNFAHTYPKGKIWYREAESAFDLDYAAALGMPLDRIKFRDDLETVEDFYDDLRAQAKKAEELGVSGLYILDSLDALSDKSEMERDIDKGTYGAQKAKQMSTLFRKLVRRIRATNIHLMIISQVRDNIGVTFGRKFSRSGGRALDFYASQVVYLALIEKIHKTKAKQKRTIGIRVRAKCDKNKIGLPFRECDFNIIFGFGVEDYQAGLEWLADVKKLELLGISEKAVPDFIHDCMLWDEDEYKAHKSKLDTALLTAWTQVESSFLPKRRKYL